MGFIWCKTKLSSNWIWVNKFKKHKENKKILNFTEKPNKKLALSLIKTKNIFWNSGIFAGITPKMLMSIQKHAPDIYYKSIEAWEKIKKIN